MKQNKNGIGILMGAGASVSIGIPAMQGIYNAFLDKRKSSISDNDKATAKLLTQKLGVSPDLEELLLACNSIIEFQNSKLNGFVEKSISPQSGSSKIDTFKIRLNERVGAIQDLKFAILEFLAQQCFQFDRDRAVTVNESFVRAACDNRVPIFTTNYDFSLEYVARELDLSLYDNFERMGQRYLWNNSMSYDGADGTELVKLHGSVTWYLDSDETIERLESYTNINTAGRRSERILIIPTRFKDIYSNHFFALYLKFVEFLMRARMLVVVGHSLRDDYLRAAIVERMRRGSFQLLVVSPDFPDAIRNVLPPARQGTIGPVMHVPHKWEDFSDELADVLCVGTAEQVGEQVATVINKRKRGKNTVRLVGRHSAFKAGEAKKIRISAKAYLQGDAKPAFVRVWMEAKYKDAEGQEKVRVTSNFLETKELLVGISGTGLVDGVFETNMQVPRTLEWATPGAEVKLMVALVGKVYSTPMQARARSRDFRVEKIVQYRI